MKANDKTDELGSTEQISVFHGRHEHAEYRRAPISLYRGNPLVEALPNILTPKEARKLMARYPEYDPADRTAPAELRIHQMHTALNLFVPLPERSPDFHSESFQMDYRDRFPVSDARGCSGDARRCFA